jgi:hypothetical protein
VKRFLSSTGGPDVEVGPVVDCHQHVWPEALADALRQRPTGPRLDGTTLLLDGEPPSEIEVGGLAKRRAQDAADGVDLALLSLSTALGVESLPPEEAAPVLEAWHALADELEPHHGLWAATGLVEPDLARLREQLAHPRVHGLQLPASALATPEALEQLAPVLTVAEQADLPVLVHPGPAPAVTDADALPSWWPAMTDYPAQQAAAWYAWHVAGRALAPRLRVGFVALAGLAPLHHERLAQRGGTLGPIDTQLFYETSSYGARAVDAMVRVVGVDPLVHGSDRPNAVPVDPGLGDAFSRAIYVTNPHRLLQGATP